MSTTSRDKAALTDVNIQQVGSETNNGNTQDKHNENKTKGINKNSSERRKIKWKTGNKIKEK
jgi:hypothetical protein